MRSLLCLLLALLAENGMALERFEVQNVSFLKSNKEVADKRVIYAHWEISETEKRQTIHSYGLKEGVYMPLSTFVIRRMDNGRWFGEFSGDFSFTMELTPLSDAWPLTGFKAEKGFGPGEKQIFDIRYSAGGSQGVVAFLSKGVLSGYYVTKGTFIDQKAFREKVPAAPAVKPSSAKP